MNDAILLAGQESVLGVLVKMAAIRGAGRTINQRWSRGGAGALTEALQFPPPSPTHPYTHTPSLFSPCPFPFKGLRVFRNHLRVSLMS